MIRAALVEIVVLLAAILVTTARSGESIGWRAAVSLRGLGRIRDRAERGALVAQP
jgi:hypothetical protein